MRQRISCESALTLSIRQIDVCHYKLEGCPLGNFAAIVGNFLHPELNKQLTILGVSCYHDHSYEKIS